MIIPAYNFGEGPFQTTEEEYIKNTLVTRDKEETRKELSSFANELADSISVKDFINIIISDDALLSKTFVVKDLSYRNAVASLGRNLINYVQPQSEYYKYLREDYKEFLQKVKNDCESLFIYLDKRDDLDREADEQMDREFDNALMRVF